MQFSLPIGSVAFTRSALLMLVLGAFGWRIQGLTQQSLWRDEVDAIYFALRALPDTLAMFLQAGQNGPLYFLALRFWFYMAGATEYALRFPSAVFGTLSIPLLFQVTRLLLSGACAPLDAAFNQGTGELSHPAARRVGGDAAAAVPLLAAALLAANPYQLWYSQEGKMYALITALSLLATWCWLRGITRGGWVPWLAYLVTMSVSMYAHLLMILLIPVHLLWFLIAWPQSRAHWRGYGLAVAGLTLPYLPMVWWQWDLLTTAEKRTGFSFTPLLPMAQTLVLNHSRGFLPEDNLLLVAPIFFLALAGVVLGMTALPTALAHGSGRKLCLSPWRRWLLVVSWVLAPVAEIYAMSLRQPIFTDRYIIWVAPAAMILLALGAVVLYHNAGRLGAPLTALFLLYIVSFWLYAGWQQKTLPMKYDLRSAVGFVASRRAPATLLILQIPHMEWSYRYYTSDFQADLFSDSDARLGRWVPGLWTNGGAPDDEARAEVDRQMRELTVGVSELWVFRSEVEMWDARHLMDEWLDQHAQMTDQAEFHGAQVKRYEMVNGE